MVSQLNVDKIYNEGGDNDSGINLDTNDTVKFDIAGSTKWTLNSSGNLFPAATTQGIVLGATSDTAANRLEDYEEGTWTPTDQSGGSLSMTVWVATYTKIGNQVFFEIGFAFPTTSDSNDIRLSLPFTALNTGDNTGGAILTGTNSSRQDCWLVLRNTSNLACNSIANSSVSNATYSAKQVKIAGQYTAA